MHTGMYYIMAKCSSLLNLRVYPYELATLYAHSNFLEMSSLYEEFRLTLVEANHYGVPVITSDCSSLPEVAGDAGLLINPLDEQSIAEGLHQLIMRDGLRDELAANARANAARFSWQRAASEMQAPFKQAVIVHRNRD
jgi:glycosyltransferase involved in cell wall biosynthesis